MLHTFLNFLTTTAIRSSKLSIDIKKTTFLLFCVNHIHLNSLISHTMTQALTPNPGSDYCCHNATAWFQKEIIMCNKLAKPKSNYWRQYSKARHHFNHITSVHWSGGLSCCLSLGQQNRKRGVWELLADCPTLSSDSAADQTPTSPFQPPWPSHQVWSAPAPTGTGTKENVTLWTASTRHMLFASKQKNKPGWVSGVKSQTLWSWTCRTRPRCRRRHWVKLC